MKLKVILAFSLLALSRFAFAGAANEQDLTELSIEELLNVEVISASRLSQKANKSASSASILTADDIRTYGWRTLADALNGLRGLFTSNNRNYSFLGVRGFIQPNDYNSRVLIMVDGQRMNENVYDTGNIAQEFILDTDLIERIEFIPGSGSSVYGANAFLGFINVVTKKGSSINGVQAAGEAGTFDTYKGRMSYGKKLANGADVLVSASHFDSAGVSNLYLSAFDDPSTNNGIAHNMDAERSDRLFGKFQFQGLTVSAGLVDRFKRLPTASSSDIFNNPESMTDDRQIYGNVKYDKTINDKTSLTLQGYFQDYEYNGKTPFINEIGEKQIFHDGTIGRWFGGDAQLTTRAFDRHRLMMGVEYQYDLSQQLLSYTANPFYIYDNHRYNGHRVEWYVQDDFELRDDLVLSAGFRFDYHHMIKSLPLNPRVGLIWNPLASTTLKLLYSSTFRAPNASELEYNAYYYDSAVFPSEEQIKSYESIVEWHSPDGLKLFGSLFFNDISRLISICPDSQLLENMGGYHVYGTELEIEKRWHNGRHFKASYTYNFASNNLTNGTRGVGSPESLFKLHYAEPLFGNYAKLAVENIFIGSRKTLQGNLADAYDLININLTSDRLLKGFDMSLGVYNLLDDNYQVVGDEVNNILIMNGREFRLKFVYTY